MTGIERIAAERQRQVEEEGWTADHDDGHDRSELASAAAAYALYAHLSVMAGYSNDQHHEEALELWPFEETTFKPVPGNPIRNLEKAGALIAAEIDRILRERAGRGR